MQKRDITNILFSLITFVIGLAMIGYAFWLAYGLFHQPPTVAMQISPGQPMDFGGTAAALIQVLIKIAMLLLMTIFGSAFATRGIKLYEAGRPRLTRVNKSKNNDEPRTNI